MGFILNMERHTLAGEGVDNLFLDTFLTLGETLVLGEREATDSWGMRVPTFPTAMTGDGVSRELDWLYCVVDGGLPFACVGWSNGGLNLNVCVVTAILTPHFPER